MTVYAVTGASGHLGRFAIQNLLARGVAPPDVVPQTDELPGLVDELLATILMLDVGATN
jgi:hypothetical protein